MPKDGDNRNLKDKLEDQKPLENNSNKKDGKPGKGWEEEAIVKDVQRILSLNKT